MYQICYFIARFLETPDYVSLKKTIRAEVKELCSRFPLYSERHPAS